MDTKRVNITMPMWQYEKYVKGSTKETERVRELITKGIMYEQEDKILMMNNRQKDNADSVSLSRDSTVGLGGFPESVA